MYNWTVSRSIRKFRAYQYVNIQMENVISSDFWECQKGDHHFQMATFKRHKQKERPRGTLGLDMSSESPNWDVFALKQALCQRVPSSQWRATRDLFPYTTQDRAFTANKRSDGNTLPRKNRAPRDRWPHSKLADMCTLEWGNIQDLKQHQQQQRWSSRALRNQNRPPKN